MSNRIRSIDGCGDDFDECEQSRNGQHMVTVPLCDQAIRIQNNYRGEKNDEGGFKSPFTFANTIYDEVHKFVNATIVHSIFCKLKPQKTWILFFCKLEKLEKQKNMNFIFCKLAKPQETWISFFAMLQNLKKHGFHFCKLAKPQKNMNFIFCKLQNPQKTMNFIFCKLKKPQKT